MPRHLEQTTKLAIAREGTGLSREQVCARAQEAGFSLSCSSLVHYERGKRHPRVDLGKWLAVLYGKELGELFNDEEGTG